MEENNKFLESLLESATEYGKTSLELAKLKALDKTADVVSTLVPHSVVVILASAFFMFLNLGLAIWLGDILGKMYYGFLAISALYAVAGIIIHFFMHKKIKKLVGDSIVKHMLK
jgi:hypothetical protein